MAGPFATQAVILKMFGIFLLVTSVVLVVASVMVSGEPPASLIFVIPELLAGTLACYAGQSLENISNSAEYCAPGKKRGLKKKQEAQQMAAGGKLSRVVNLKERNVRDLHEGLHYLCIKLRVGAVMLVIEGVMSLVMAVLLYRGNHPYLAPAPEFSKPFEVFMGLLGILSLCMAIYFLAVAQSAQAYFGGVIRRQAKTLRQEAQAADDLEKGAGSGADPKKAEQINIVKLSTLVQQ